MSKHQDLLISHAEAIEKKKCAKEGCVSNCINSDSIDNNSSISISSKNEDKSDTSNKYDAYVYEATINAEILNETNKEQEKEKEISDSQYTEGTHFSVTCNSQSDKENVTDDDDDTSTNINTTYDLSKKDNSIIFIESCQNEKKKYNNKIDANVMNDDETDEYSIGYTFPKSSRNIYSENGSMNTTSLLYGYNKENDMNDLENSISGTFAQITQQLKTVEKKDDKKEKVEGEIEEENYAEEETVFENIKKDFPKMSQQKEQDRRGNDVVDLKKQINKFSSTEGYLNSMCEIIETKMEKEINLQMTKEMKIHVAETCEIDTEKQQKNNSLNDEYEQLKKGISEQIESKEKELIQNKSVETAQKINSVVKHPGDYSNLNNNKNFMHEINEKMDLSKDILNSALSEYITENKKGSTMQNDVDINKGKQCEASRIDGKSSIANYSGIAEYDSTYKKSNGFMFMNNIPLSEVDTNIMKNESASIMKKKRKYSLNDITGQKPICKQKTSSLEQIMSVNSVEKANDTFIGNSVDYDSKSNNTCNDINENDTNTDGNSNSNNSNNNVNTSNANVSYPISNAVPSCLKSGSLVDFELNQFAEGNNGNNLNSKFHEKNRCSFGSSHTQNFSNFFIAGKRGRSDESACSNHAALSNCSNSFSCDDLPNDDVVSDTTEKNTNKDFKLSCSEIEFLNNASAATNDGEKVMQWFDAIYTVCVRLDDLCCRLNSNFPHSMQMWENSNASNACNLKSLLFNKDLKNKMDNTAEDSCSSENIGNNGNNEYVNSFSDLFHMNINKFNRNTNGNAIEGGNFSNIFINNGCRANTDLIDTTLNDMSNIFYKNLSVGEMSYSTHNEQGNMFPMVNEMNISPTNVRKNNDDDRILCNDTFNKTDITEQNNSNNKINNNYNNHNNSINDKNNNNDNNDNNNNDKNNNSDNKRNSKNNNDIKNMNNKNDDDNNNKNKNKNNDNKNKNIKNNNKNENHNNKNNDNNNDDNNNTKKNDDDNNMDKNNNRINNNNCEYMACKNEKRISVNSNNSMKKIYNEVNYGHVQEIINTRANNFFYHSNNMHPQNVNEMYLKESGEHFNLKKNIMEYEETNEQNKAINDCDLLNMLHTQTPHMVMNETRYLPMVNSYGGDPNQSEIVDLASVGSAKIPVRTRVRKNSKMNEASKTEEKKTPRKKNSISKKSNKTIKSESEFEYLLELSDKEGPSSENPDDLKCDVAGVYWDKRSWIASWYDNGKRYYKSFSAKTHGFYKSKFCAIKVRLSKVKGRTIFGKNVSGKRSKVNGNSAAGNLSSHINTTDMQMYNANLPQQHQMNIPNNMNHNLNNNENEERLNF